MDEALLSRVEDAGLNASAPPQQRWLDGWLLRYSPGKAKRARCINALAVGRLPLQDKLRQAQAVYDEAGLPAVVRITPFTQPAGLDAWFAERGWTVLDDTRVMVCSRLPTSEPAALPAGTGWEPLDAAAYAQAVGDLRGSPPEQRLAHAQRLAVSPVPYRGYAIRRVDDGAILACGQFAREATFIGVYDVHTHPQARGQGLASVLCKRLLALAASEGAAVAYLQVDAANDAARRIYQRLGFADGYAYHYRQAP
ncbi:MAG: GNAT family N-acetyltransferase [Rubrivivax sp.]|nr:GNAT family N-acetyltransferase [Rubrivivax sp.]